MKHTSASGFTLLELLAVMIIIISLATVALIASRQFSSKATGIEAATWFQTTELALEQYQVACGQYPPQTNSEALLPYDASEGCATGTTLGSFFLESERERVADVRYFAIAREIDPAGCIGYHLGIELADDEDSRLAADSDISTTALPAGFVACQTGGLTPSGINGADPVYDVVRPSALQPAL